MEPSTLEERPLVTRSLVGQVFLETPLWVRPLGTPRLSAAGLSRNAPLGSPLGNAALSCGMGSIFPSLSCSLCSQCKRRLLLVSRDTSKTGWTIFRRSLAGGVPKRYHVGAQRLFPPGKKPTNKMYKSLLLEPRKRATLCSF